MHAYLPTFSHSVEYFRIWTMYPACHNNLRILRNHKFYRISRDSPQMDVKSLIQGTLSPSKDDLWAVMLYTNANGACPSGTERTRLRQEMARWIQRGKGRGLWKLFRENTKTFLNVPFGMIPDSVDQMLAGMGMDGPGSAVQCKGRVLYR